MPKSPMPYRLLFVMLVAVVSVAVPARAGNVGAVKSRLMFAQEDADKGHKDDALSKLDDAEKFLDGLSDAEKAPLLTQIEELREKLKSTVDPEISGRIERDIGRALSGGEDDVNDNPSKAAPKLEQALAMLSADDAKKNLNPDARKKLEARAAALAAKIKGNTASEDTRLFAEYVQKNLDAANDSAANDPDFARTRLNQVAELLASDEGRQKLDADTIQRLRGSLAEAEGKLFDLNKKRALRRAAGPLKQLEDTVATDPFKGRDPSAAYNASSQIDSYKARVKDQIQKLPGDDADRRAIEARLLAAQKKIDAYDAAWGAANVEAAIVNRWKSATFDAEGWQAEKYAPGPRAFEKPKLDKTERVARQIKWFLAARETADARKDLARTPKAAEAITAAERTLADAQAALDAAFNQWMDAAEKQARPQGATRFEIGATRDMAQWADDHLAGSRYHDADIARAKRLDQRWQDEIAALQRQHEEALKRLTAEADAAWPKVAGAYNAQDGFRPSNAAEQMGKTFRFQHVRCRTGWDFDGAYDLTFWVDSHPVGGNFGPKVAKAFKDAAAQIGDGVNDHID